MSPRYTSTKQPTKSDLFGMVVDELDASIYKPNILSFGQKSYPEQQRFLECDAPGRFVSGGNRGGKTDAVVVDAIWWASNTHPYLKRPDAWGHGPLMLRFVVVDVAKGVEQIMLPKFRRWMTNSMLVNGSWDQSWDSKNMILTFSNGSQIDFVTWGMELAKLGGVPRHLVYFDEEPPQNIFTETMMRLLDYRGRWVIAATPTKGMGWTYDLLWEPAEEHKDDPDWKVRTFTLSAEQNPYLEATDDDMDFYTMGMDKEEREIREHGSFVARSGLVFPQFKAHLEKFVLPVHLAPNKSWRWYTSVDHGWNNPTAWLWHAVGPNGDIYTFAEHYADHMTVAQHAQVVKDRERGFGREPDMRTGDPAMKQGSGITGTSVLQTYAMNGLHIAVEGIPHDVQTGIEKMQQYMLFRADGMPTWRISPNCHNLIRELKRLRWKTYSSEKMAYDLNKQEEIHKKDDHAADSVRYFFTLMPDLKPIPEQEIPADEKIPTTISYTDMIARLRADESVEFVEDTASDGWQTVTGWDD